MTPTQEGHSGSRSGRVPAQFYVDEADWRRFRLVSAAHDRSRSEHVRELIRREIAAFDTEVLRQAA